MTISTGTGVVNLLERALKSRVTAPEGKHNCGLRLFNGFSEGFPSLTADLYGRTVVLFLHKVLGVEADALMKVARDFYTGALPWIRCVIAKQRSSPDQWLRRGEIVFGNDPDTRIIENGVSYSLDLLMNQDASFYLDTRNLRAWLARESAGREVLNAFAYTGSLGVAALAGGAKRVLQMDHSRKFLDLAQRSAAANHLDSTRMKCFVVDFFVGVGQLKSRGELFDIVLIDPPYFSITEKGKVDLVTESTRLINKVRPLVRDGGQLVVVNNALFLGGQDFVDSLTELGKDGYLTLDERIDVPEDVTGYPETRVGFPPADPAPFNQSTKIVVLGVKRN